MSAKLPEHAVSLAAASSTTEEDFKHLALQQPHLGSVDTRGPGNPNLGLDDHRVIFSSARPLRAQKPHGGPSLQLIELVLVLDSLDFPCRIVHQRRDFDHVAMRYLRLMRLLRLAPAAIQQGLRSS